MSALEELRRLHEAATPGPWGAQWPTMCSSLGASMHSHVAEACVHGGDEDDGVADAALIAAMRNALPGLLDLWEAAKGAKCGNDCDICRALKALQEESP